MRIAHRQVIGFLEYDPHWVKRNRARRVGDVWELEEPKGKDGPPPAPRLPAPPEVLDARRAACDACPHNQRIRDVAMPGKPLVVLVKCAKCPKCGNAKSLSDPESECPLRIWRRVEKRPADLGVEQ